MNCKPNDWAMVVRRIAYRCPQCGELGALDLRPQVVHVTQLCAITPLAMWLIEKPLRDLKVRFDCGGTGVFDMLDALPDRALQPLPKITDEEDIDMQQSLPAPGGKVTA